MALRILFSTLSTGFSTLSTGLFILTGLLVLGTFFLVLSIFCWTTWLCSSLYIDVFFRNRIVFEISLRYLSLSTALVRICVINSLTCGCLKRLYTIVEFLLLKLLHFIIRIGVLTILVIFLIFLIFLLILLIFLILLGRIFLSQLKPVIILFSFYLSCRASSSNLRSSAILDILRCVQILVNFYLLEFSARKFLLNIPPYDWRIFIRIFFLLPLYFSILFTIQSLLSLLKFVFYYFLNDRRWDLRIFLYLLGHFYLFYFEKIGVHGFLWRLLWFLCSLLCLDWNCGF